ncbi:alpha-amylase family protein [Paenibacillus cymbidii]|uniref:alpha-galactosidase n=1 Tax=Paenibacillus cymbidii TaxID=1639034 RepID=UPI00108188CC|nr:alpha-galactosidase [Paenibacillus cymbidii]
MKIAVGKTGEWQLACEDWPALFLSGLVPVVEADGAELAAEKATVEAGEAEVGGSAAAYEWAGVCRLEIQAEAIGAGGARVTSRVRSVGPAPIRLGAIRLFAAVAERSAPVFGARPERVVLMKQSNYRADVVMLADAAAAGAERLNGAGEPNEAEPASARDVRSEHVWLAYDRDARQALLAGFASSERWNGAIELAADGDGNVLSWSVGYASNDLLLQPGEEAALEDLLLLQGSEPLDLLDAYGDMTARGQDSRDGGSGLPAETPVSWCSWYPYRLGVTEERLLETARIAAHRLQPLGLSVIEADLGWERDQLPHTFEENEQFPQGLGWLSQQLGEMGFRLGVWKAPYQISEFDETFREHPEWLVPGEDGKPAALGTWFWKPNGDVYSLDLTHPGAQMWLRERIRSLAERGVTYFKADFIGQPGLAVTARRHDKAIGAGPETGRIGARIIREELPDALILNCGGPEMPGTGQWPLLYTCYDTGNTGLITWPFQRDNFRALALHLWKNRRWGIIQASCLCVGLPGTLEEARIRATAAFLSGGQIDISDTLQTLPEDRWAVLEATLPPLGKSARAIDLFEPIYDPGSIEYETLCRGETQDIVQVPHSPGSVWHLRVETDWDAWDLAAVFAIESDGDKMAPRRYRIPFERLGLDGGRSYEAYEFWSGQYLGLAPSRRRNPNGYEHPGDMQDLLTGDGTGALELAFTGPAVKLIRLREAKPHPWVVGTSFHQSGGAELADVSWDARERVLSGRLLRPAGHSGFVALATAGLAPVAVVADGAPAAIVAGASGSWQLRLTTRQADTRWSVRFAAAE